MDEICQPAVSFSCPVLHRFNALHSSYSCGPAALWIAPSTVKHQCQWQSLDKPFIIKQMLCLLLLFETRLISNGTWTFRTLDYSYPGLFVPSMDYSYLGLFVPWTEGAEGRRNRKRRRRIYGLFVPSLDFSYPGLFVPSWTVRTMDCSYLPRTFRTAD